MGRKSHHFPSGALEHMPERGTGDNYSHESVSVPDIIMIHRQRLIRFFQPFRVGNVSVSKRGKILGMANAVAVKIGKNNTFVINIPFVQIFHQLLGGKSGVRGLALHFSFLNYMRSHQKILKCSLKLTFQISNFFQAMLFRLPFFRCQKNYDLLIGKAAVRY